MKPGSPRPECLHNRVLNFFLDYMAGFLLSPIVRRQRALIPSSHYRAQIPLWGLQYFDFFQTQLLLKCLSSKNPSHWELRLQHNNFIPWTLSPWQTDWCRPLSWTPPTPLHFHSHLNIHYAVSAVSISLRPGILPCLFLCPLYVSTGLTWKMYLTSVC